MIVRARGARRVLTAGAVALTLAGCGGGAGDDRAAAVPSAVSADASGAELAGVRIDVRRDPG